MPWLTVGRCCGAQALHRESEPLLAQAAEVDDMYALLADFGQRIPTAEQVMPVRGCCAV